MRVFSLYKPCSNYSPKAISHQYLQNNVNHIHNFSWNYFIQQNWRLYASSSSSSTPMNKNSLDSLFSLVKPREHKPVSRNARDELEREKSKISVQQKITLYDIWRKEGHAFSLNLFKEFMLLCMIESRFEEQYHDKCFAIYEDLKAAGYKPDMDCYTFLIQSCARANKIEKAFDLKKQFQSEGIQLSPVAYTALIRACALSTTETKPKERAKQVFDESKKLGQIPDYVDFEILYKHLREL